MIVVLSFLASLLIGRAIFLKPNQKLPVTENPSHSDQTGVAPTTPAAEPTQPAEEEMAKQVAEDYPLFYKTPKRKENWAAFYTDELQLTVQYLENADLAAVKEEVFAWMEEEGISPDTHTLQWQEITASTVSGEKAR